MLVSKIGCLRSATISAFSFGRSRSFWWTCCTHLLRSIRQLLNCRSPHRSGLLPPLDNDAHFSQRSRSECRCGAHVFVQRRSASLGRRRSNHIGCPVTLVGEVQCLPER